MTIAQYDIKPVAKFRCLNLLRICLGDGGDKVGIDDTDLHEVAGIIETQIAILVILIIKSQIIKQNLLVIFTLVCQVVDCQDVLDVSDRFDRIESDLAQSRQDRSVIVVFMTDIRIIIHLDHHFDDGHIEERESCGIVLIAIDTVTVEECVILDEQIFNTFIHI